MGKADKRGESRLASNDQRAALQQLGDDRGEGSERDIRADQVGTAQAGVPDAPAEQQDPPVGAGKQPFGRREQD